MPRVILSLILLCLSVPAIAYVGPGAGISVLGSLLGILATIFVAIGAILFWPIRKLIKRRKARAEPGETKAAATGE
jgi:nicotinamide riboside transporter PnuC